MHGILSTVKRLGTGMVILVSTAVSAHAASLAVESAAVTPDQSLQLGVALGSGAGEEVASLQFDVLFDASAVSITEVTAGAAAIAAGKQAVFAPQGAGRVRVIVLGVLSQTIIGDGDVAELQVKMAAQAPGGSYSLSLTGAVLSDPFGESVPVSVAAGALTVGTASPHSADINEDWKISLSEILRVIQFYAFDSLHCDAGSEDGYAPGPGDQSCGAHDSDYQPTNWVVGISELLRLIQLFNTSGYHAEAGTEDGFAPDTEGLLP